ncbi:MAG: NfeD family protein [candidate division Zixibacteria bacterium]|nr:NfeD family protein [candidate division Zixibacteria bacterium]
MSTTFWVWMAVAVIFLILELTNLSLYFICFVAGSVAAGILSYFSPELYYWQIGVFLIVTLGLLPLTREIAKKITKNPPRKSNVDALVGQIGLVTKEIDPDLGGQILINNETWNATADLRIEKGKKVEIVSIIGTRLQVKSIEK